MPKKVIVIEGKKQCTKCLEWKELRLFHVQKSVKSGRTTRCGECINTRNHQCRQTPGTENIRREQYRQKRLQAGLSAVGHTQHIIGNRKRCTKCKIWKKTDRFCLSSKNSSGLSCECKKCKSEAWVAYHRKNKEKVRAIHKKHYYDNPDKMKLRRENGKRRKNELERIRDKTDICFKLNKRIRVNMNHSLKYNGTKNGRHWETLVEYTLGDLKKHLERKFINGMTWDNYGEWHIDHIIPISAFNFTDPSHTDFKRCWSLKNLQPLWAFDNMSKSDKLEKPFQPSLQL